MANLTAPTTDKSLALEKFAVCLRNPTLYSHPTLVSSDNSTLAGITRVSVDCGLQERPRSACYLSYTYRTKGVIREVKALPYTLGPASNVHDICDDDGRSNTSFDGSKSPTETTATFDDQLVRGSKGSKSARSVLAAYFQKKFRR